jgi:hypothetical protein
MGVVGMEEETEMLNHPQNDALVKDACPVAVLFANKWI